MVITWILCVSQIMRYTPRPRVEAYAEYQKKVPRLVPNVAGIGALFEAAFDKQAGEDESEREP